MKDNILFNYHLTLEKLFSLLREFSPYSWVDVTIDKEHKGSPECTTIKLVSNYDVLAESQPKHKVLAQFSTTDKVEVDTEKIIADIVASQPEILSDCASEDAEGRVDDAINAMIIDAYYNALKDKIVTTSAVDDNELRGMVNACYELDMYSGMGGSVKIGDKVKTATTGLEEFIKYLQEKDMFDYPLDTGANTKS